MTLPTNGRASPLAIPGEVVITTKPYGVPSGEVEWTATRKSDGQATTVRAQTWFFARAAAMAEFGCDPHDVEVVRA